MRAFNMLSVALVAGTLAGAPAAAAEPSKKADPNEIVCEKQEVVGSRLAVKKVCLTRAQWAEQRQLDRQAIDKAQKNPMKGN